MSTVNASMKNNDYILGVDIGGTTIKFGVVDQTCCLIDTCSINTCSEQGDIAIVSRIIEKAAELRNTYPFKAVGIGTPGTVNFEAGICVRAANLPYNNTPIVAMVEEALSCPVFLGNDATCAVMGELYAGYGKQYRNFVMVTLGTGVGGGIVIDGKPYLGSRGGAGEIGHMIIDCNGKSCRCGQRGCYEQYASVTALIEQTQAAAYAYPQSLLHQMCSKPITGKTVFDAASAGCSIAIQVIDQFADYVAAGLTSLTRIFQPEAIILGGAISNQQENLLLPISKKCTLPVEIKISQLKNDAGVLGAAALAII